MLEETIQARVYGGRPDEGRESLVGKICGETDKQGLGLCELFKLDMSCMPPI